MYNEVLVQFQINILYLFEINQIETTNIFFSLITRVLVINNFIKFSI